MEPLRNRSLALGILPWLLVGLMVQSGAWACGCPEHNPWVLASLHCLGATADHHDALALAHEHPELDDHHIPGRDAYVRDAHSVTFNPLAIAAETLWVSSLWETASPVVDRPRRDDAPHAAQSPGVPLRALLQVYLI